MNKPVQSNRKTPRNKSKSERESPVRAGAFAELTEADAAVSQLLSAGFTKDQITVICSDESKERHFRQFEQQEPAGQHAGNAALAGTTLGAVAGGLAAIAVATATAGVPLIVAGAAGLSGGSALGGFLGTMLTRGEEKEVSNYYDQAVRLGKILVSVEEHGPRAANRLAEAEQILARAGAEPVALPEGDPEGLIGCGNAIGDVLQTPESCGCRPCRRRGICPCVNRHVCFHARPVDKS